MNAGYVAYKLAYQISPIILTGGIAKSIPGGSLPIVTLTEGASFGLGLLTGKPDIDLDQFFAHFEPATGSQLVNNDIGMYPFANMQVAANAIIQQPLNVSMIMKVHPRAKGAMITRALTGAALKVALEKHSLNGGTYTILTPMFMYTDCVITAMTDVSRDESAHPQNEWRLDFIKPLVTKEDAKSVYSTLLDKMNKGLKIDKPTWTASPTKQIGVGSPVSL